MSISETIKKDFSKLEKEKELSKAELWRNFELLTYLAAAREIGLEEATYYINIIFNKLEELEP